MVLAPSFGLAPDFDIAMDVASLSYTEFRGMIGRTGASNDIFDSFPPVSNATDEFLPVLLC